jgi:hypothetical protein
MTRITSEEDQLESLTRRLRELELERTRRGRWRLILGALMVCMVLSAASPVRGLSVVEARLAALETLIRQGPGGSSQVRAPFHVLDGSGKVLLNVGGATTTAGAVNIERQSATSGTVLHIWNDGGDAAAVLGISRVGRGYLELRAPGGNSPVVYLGQEGKGGVVQITNGTSVISKHFSSSDGGGKWQLANAAGVAVLQAGETTGGCGKVETFPYNAPRAVVGLAGSYIMGRGC